MHNEMTDYEKLKIENELKSFTTKNFVKPADCKNTEQIQFYIKELCTKIEEYNLRFNYVPDLAYSLLNQYNMAQNKIVSLHFKPFPY
jgi:hypothetical protein